MSPDTHPISWYEFIDKFKVYIGLFVFSWYLLLKFLWKLVYFVPTLRSIFASMNVELPLMTRLLLSASDKLQNYWFVMIPLLFWLFGRFTYRTLRQLKTEGLGPKGTDTRVRSFLILMGVAILLLALEGLAYFYVYSPMLKLITCVE